MVFLNLILEKLPIITKKARQPQVVSGNSKANPKKTTTSNFQSTKRESNLKGNLQKFDDIPDNISTFTKRSMKSTKTTKSSLKKPEKELTGKPNNMIISKGNSNVEEISGHFSAPKARKELTDKPNNIYAPIDYDQFN